MEIHSTQRSNALSELSEATLVRPWSVRELSTEEVRSLFKSYEMDFKSLDSDGQTRLLQEFILSDSITATELSPLLDQMSPQQKSEIARFLAYDTDRRDMTEIFQRCWSSLPYNEREPLEKHLIRSDRGGVLMVAPFADLTRKQILLPKRINEDHHLERKIASPLEVYFNDIESAQQLFNSGLREERWERPDTVLEYYARKSKALLVHYLPDLVATGNVSLKKAQDILTKDDEYLKNLGDLSFFKTDEERGKQEKLYQVAKRVVPTASPFGDRWPEKLREEYDSIDAKASARRSDTLFSRFSEIEPLFPTAEQRMEFLRKAVAAGVPVLAYLDTLKLSSAETQELIAFTKEQFTFPLFDPQMRDVRQLVKRGEEKFVVESLLSAIKYSSSLNRLINSIEEVEEILSPSSFKKIVNGITTAHPQLWCERLDFVAKSDIISLEKLVSLLASEEYGFAQSYYSLWNHTRGDSRHQEELHSLALKVLDAAPHIVFEKRFSNFLLTSEQKRHFVEDHLNDSDSPSFRRFLIEGVRKLQGHSDLSDLQESFRRGLRENPSVLVALGEEDLGWEEVKKLFSAEERSFLLCKGIESADLEKLLARPPIVRDLVTHPSDFKFILEQIESTGEVGAYRSLCEAAVALDDLPRAGRDSVRLLKRKVLEAAKVTPSIVFFDEAPKFLGRDAESLIAEKAEGYVAPAPKRLLTIEKLLSPDLYERLFEKHLHEIALCPSRSGSPLYSRSAIPNELRGEIARLNPLERVMDEEKGNLYELLLMECMDLTSYELFSSRLEEIAIHESLPIEKEGIDWRSVKPEFLSLVRRAAALDASPLFNHYRGDVTGSPQREEVAKLLELAFLKGVNLERYTTLDDDLREVREQLSSVMEEVFQVESFEIPEGIDVETLHALSVYYNGRCSENRGLKEPFREMLQQIVSRSFESWRAWGVSGESNREKRLLEMQSEGLLPRQLSLSQYEAWLEEWKSTGEERLEYSQVDFIEELRRIINRAISDQHLPDPQVSYEEAKSTLSTLLKPLHELEVLKEEIRRASEVKGSGVEDLYRECTKEIKSYLDENRSELAETRARLALVSLREGKADFSSSGELIVDERKIAIDSLSSLLEGVYGSKYPEFSNDIKQLHQTILHFRELWLNGQQGVSLSITDKPTLKTHLLIGERPVPSCQSWDSSGEYNKGLLSYCIDPGVRVIQVYGEEGIVARAVMRLLEDSEGFPTLFLERIYSKHPHPYITEAITKGALEKAEGMGIPLYALYSDEAAPQGATVLFSRGSRSRYVYTDGGGGLVKDGLFTIRAHRLSAPL